MIAGGATDRRRHPLKVGETELGGGSLDIVDGFELQLFIPDDASFANPALSDFKLRLH